MGIVKKEFLKLEGHNIRKKLISNVGVNWSAVSQAEVLFMSCSSYSNERQII